MNRARQLATLALMLPLLATCQRSTEPPTPTPLRELPVTLTVPQRSTTAVPGSAGLLFIRTGDVTLGQVNVTLSDGQGATVMPTQSMYSGAQRTFGYAGAAVRSFFSFFVHAPRFLFARGPRSSAVSRMHFNVVKSYFLDRRRTFSDIADSAALPRSPMRLREWDRQDERATQQPKEHHAVARS